MSKFITLTASGLVKTGTGTIQAINITKAGDAAATVIIYDNTSAAGTQVFNAVGAISQSFIQGITGATVSNGIFVAITGTTLPQVQVIYE